MGFTEEKQKKGPPAGGPAKKEQTEFTLRISLGLQKRLAAVAEIKGTTMKQIVEDLISAYVSEEIKKVLDKSSKYKT